MASFMVLQTSSRKSHMSEISCSETYSHKCFPWGHGVRTGKTMTNFIHSFYAFHKIFLFFELSVKQQSVYKIAQPEILSLWIKDIKNGLILC
jgi:hypothetical protein